MAEINQEIELSYNLKEKDLIDLKMYCASLNDKINRQRKINRYAILIICIIIGGIYTYKGNVVTSTYFFSMGIICFFLYPWYLNWFYRRIFRKQVVASDFPIHVWLKIDEVNIVTLAKGITSTTLLADIEEIVELEESFYLKKSKTDWIVIPKSELDNEDEVRAFLTSTALVNDITYSEKNEFKWK